MDLSAKQRVLVKPNFVVIHKPLAATHVDAVRAVLDFVRARYDGPITVAEGPSIQPAADEGFRLQGYEPLADLNHDEPLPVDVYDWRLRPLRLHLARSVVESDFCISVGPPKTHDVVMVTLDLKELVGCIQPPRVFEAKGNYGSPDLRSSRVRDPALHFLGSRTLAEQIMPHEIDLLRKPSDSSTCLHPPSVIESGYIA